ncbi:hypothetical protein L210DRAFT_985549 [Boletus edulis BED1]|uniref:Uncharacterized protein n=1 Tax=Boletus edulis BED1 TaxID=1328754 RepID=A0AAD4G8P8_BOLED|nr:hypothetical protein L210DRAFT_985549 [Boletus edulis BED1]
MQKHREHLTRASIPDYMGSKSKKKGPPEVMPVSLATQANVCAEVLSTESPTSIQPSKSAFHFFLSTPTMLTSAPPPLWPLVLATAGPSGLANSDMDQSMLSIESPTSTQPSKSASHSSPTVLASALPLL